MMNIMEMMNKIKEVQTRLKSAQKHLLDVKHTCTSGGDLVSVTVNGKKDIVVLDIDPSILNTKDKVLVQDLVIAAANKALQEVEIPAKEKLRESTADLMPPIPGLDITNIMG